MAGNSSVMASDPPTMEPPPGVTIDLSGSGSQGHWNAVTQATCLSLATIAVILRVFTTLRVIRRWRVDDAICCVSWMGLVVYGSLITVMATQYGAGEHQWNLPGSIAVQFLYLNNITQILYGPFIMITKTAILLLLGRIFAPQRTGLLYIMVHLLIWLNLIFYGAVTMVKVIQCIPRERIWDVAVDGNCIDLTAVLKTTGIFNTISDFLIFILPIREIWKLNMERRQKIGVSAAFTIGLLAVMASLFRLQVSFDQAGNPDKTYYQLAILMWSEAEIAAGVICSCLPILPALFRHYYRARHPSDPTSPAEDRRRSRLYDLLSRAGGGDPEQALASVPARRRGGLRDDLIHLHPPGAGTVCNQYVSKSDADCHGARALGSTATISAPNSRSGPAGRGARAPSPLERVVTTIRGDAHSIISSESMEKAARCASEKRRARSGSDGRGIVKTVRIDQFGARSSHER